MKVLVTGGTGVVGVSAVSALLQRGHQVRLLSRHAERDATAWGEGVESWPGDVGTPETVRGSADGCDAVLHVVGIVDEQPPHVTFERINVGGTRVIVQEAERAGVRRLVFVSSLGAERGASAYHRSKRQGEDIVRQFSGEWVIARPGSVYGPGDEQISLLLKMVRTLPAIPVIGDGTQPIQPVWADDLAVALAMAVERDGLAGRELDIAGPEMTSQRDLIQRLSRITDRSPVTVPLPDFLSSAGIKFASLFGIDVGVNEEQLTMLREGVVLEPGRENALLTVFGVAATPLEAGLKRLADGTPEQLPSEGVGTVKRKRFWADIGESRYTRQTLAMRFRTRFAEMAPFYLAVGAEPGTPTTLEEGQTVTLALPLRGNIQVRVEEATDDSITLVTLDGHPLAGAVRFLFESYGPAIRFQVQVYDRAATLPDLIIMRTVGDFLQNHTWRRVVERVIAESGGRAEGGVQQDIDPLDDQQVADIEHWLRDLIARRKRGSEELSKA